MTKCIECANITDVDGPAPNKPEKAALGMNNIDSPPGKIVETFSGGGARRNDGKELIPAANNRWYVLATVVGEQEGSTVDSELHRENRRFWNGWMCHDMGDSARRALAKTLTVSEEELEPLNEDEVERLHHRFDRAFPTEDLKKVIPFPKDVINMSSVYFSKVVCFEKFHFSAYTNFESSHFSRDTDFTAVNFIDLACFEGAHFSERTYFMHARFGGCADFENARFEGLAEFESAYVCGPARFCRVHFSKSANFSDGAFGAATLFKGAKFKTEAPKFFQRTMPQDAQFSDEARLWPKANAANAEKGQQAYTRLRQIAVENHNPDLEHFFLRQEMRCKEVRAKGLDRLFFPGYRLIADSGISVARPVMGLVFVIASGWAAIGLHLNVTGTSGTWTSFMEGLGISIGNTLPFLGLVGKMHPDFYASAPAWLDAFSGAQSVAGIVFLFFFGLGLRNRFRLK